MTVSQLSLVFGDVDCFKGVQISYFVDYPSIWVCLMFLL